MIHLPASVRVYLCLSACDMRKSFDGLQALVRDYLELDAFAWHLFVFASRRRDRVKILYWDRDGFAIWSKRLEEGTIAGMYKAEVEKEAGCHLACGNGVHFLSRWPWPTYNRIGPMPAANQPEIIRFARDMTLRWPPSAGVACKMDCG